MQVLSLKSALARLGDGIGEVIGTNQMRLLRTMGRDSSDQDSLVSLAIKLHGEEGILRDKRTRKMLFSSLRKNDAENLTFMLGIEFEGSPYAALSNASIRKNSAREKVLFNYFEVEVPEREEEAIRSETVTEINPQHGLFSHQRNALVEIERILNHEGGRAILHMPTGSGKTRTAMNLVAKELNRKKGLVIWLAHSEELCEQAAEEFEEAWSSLGDRTVSLRRFFKSHDWEESEDGIIVAGLSKLWSHLKKDQTSLHWLAPKISMVVFDEAHQSIAETFKLPVEIILAVNPECKFLGLTATPGRTWNEVDKDLKLSEFYNRKKVPLEKPGYDSPIHYLIEEGYMSKTEFNHLKYKEVGSLSGVDTQKYFDSGKELPPDILEKIAGDGMRNTRIIEKIEELISSGQHDRILFFGINVKHAEQISAFLNFVGIRSECITGATEDETRKRAIADFKSEGGDPRVLCNYGVLTTGFDAPRASAAVIARPTTSLVLYSQMVGRVIRGPKVGGTETAEVWTVVDTNLPGFDSIPGAFTNWDDVW